MKGFIRAETRFSLCGLNCALCSMRLGGHCPGCGGGAGNQSCTLARCSLEHGGIQFCWECPEYPCPCYEGFDDVDSFVPHCSRKQDIAKARAIGLEAYLARLQEKRSVLDALLADYNDGRRKTLFTTAVYLLPLEDLCGVMTALNSRPDLTGQPVKERALAAVALIQEAADCRGICLKLSKKQGKGELAMKIRLANVQDIGAWMALVEKVRGTFPGLETTEALAEHRATVLTFMQSSSAACAAEEGRVLGALLFSKENSMLCFLAVDPACRRQHIAQKLVHFMLAQMEEGKDITVTTYREGDPNGTAARAFYRKMGFSEGRLGEEFGCPVQEFFLKRPATGQK